MQLFHTLKQYDYEQVVYCYDEVSGLKAIIAIHDTTLGPALGGTRMWPYQNEEEALTDALRLSRGMTYKNAVAGLNLGGGKTVIIGDPRKDKSPELFRALGRYVQSLGGRYITAEDVGTTVDDMDYIHQETDFVTGVSPEFGSSGNPSPITAYGVFRGMKAAAKEMFGSDDLAGRTIAVQGLGNVGYHLTRHLHEEGANLIVTDINEESVKRVMNEFGAKGVSTEEIYGAEADIFAPCALGGVINDQTLPQLRVQIIAGSANNQLLEDRHGEELQSEGILYTPDYVINAGGVINVADELEGYSRERAMRKVEKIYDTLLQVFQISRTEKISTSHAADHLAETRISRVQKLRSNYIPGEKK